MAGEDEIEYFFLKEDDFEEVVSFLAEDYFQREPITLGTGANEECQPGEGRMGEDVRRCLQSGLSVGARDRKTGQLIGLRVSNLLDRQKPFQSTQPRNEFEEVYRIAEHVVNHVFEEEADKFLMMFLLSVHKDYGARGIAGRMIKREDVTFFPSVTWCDLSLPNHPDNGAQRDLSISSERVRVHEISVKIQSYLQ